MTAAEAIWRLKTPRQSHAAAKSRRLSPLNKMATVMEYDIAADGTTVTELDRAYGRGLVANGFAPPAAE